MCISNCSKSVKEVLDTKSEPISVYKVADYREGRFYSPVFNPSFSYSAGLNESGTKKKLSKKDGASIDEGIHVYRNERDAKAAAVWVDTRVVIKCEAIKADLLGADSRTAVFKRVNISVKAMANALTSAKRRTAKKPKKKVAVR